MENFWVIEAYKYGEQRFWACSPNESELWTDDINKAIHFADKGSADMVRVHMDLANGHAKTTHIDNRPKPSIYGGGVG